jgi:alkanesulfonate monooxygenase SsuD/methylene tetrahydromethanopterin reductase-like flavin-dependent oxidoreductase (luciferase family)
MATEFGLLMPHFGGQTAKDKIIEGAKKAEALGFDSVFVRDHLVFHPHGMEGTDNTFIDPFITLTAIGTVTSKIQLGFGSLIPHRHPLLLAMMIIRSNTCAANG